MTIEQLQFFPSKESFDSSDFENPSNPFFFDQVATSVYEGWNQFHESNKHFYHKTSKANMLNDAIIHCIEKNCTHRSFNFVQSLSYTRRSIGILDDKYVLLFKKSPVSNVRTYQDDLIKHQNLDKHVLFLTYDVDEYWSEIRKIEFRYYSSPRNIIYTFDITDKGDSRVLELKAPEPDSPIVKVKNSAKINKQAQ
ncbi:hypothetical protein J1N09_13730 [Aureitalea sp. L0-47]|uniref:hypothetical protein n=1 Tax=Aureitalea sp. L0-47 TaxID=2816962 RepID=UPI0022380593|nr:hypothetical protein [Aureitalea sp. L0-47]MCW5520904.1 hypothetical protein [Aureitalea sp. L0-47]